MKPDWLAGKRCMLVELWEPNERWHNLEHGLQHEFLQGIAAAARAAREDGMEILGWGALEESVSNPVPYGFCGVFLVENREALRAVDEAIRDAGWYDYFDHANVAAELDGRAGVDAGAVLSRLLGVES